MPKAPPPKRPGLPPSTTIYTEGVDPIVVKLRTEQVRQRLSDYALGQLSGVHPSRLGQMWKGAMPSLKAVRAVLDALRKGNPKFILRDSPPE